MSKLGVILFVCSAIMLASTVIVRSILGWVPFCWVTLGMALALGAAGSWYDRGFFREFFGMRATRHGMSMGWMIILVIALLTAVNFIGVRRYATWDFSSNKVNSLSDQSIKLIKDLKEDLRVVFFYKEGTEKIAEYKEMFNALIKKYQDQSPKVKLEFVEINQNPAMAEKYNIKKGTQSVLLEYQGRTNLIDKIDEQEITNALIKVTRDKDKIVYLLTGHGELPLEAEQDGASASVLKTHLAGHRYQVKPLNLAEGTIPEDADVVMILGPSQQYQDLDIKKLESYARNGGSLLIALEPRTNHGLDGFLKNVGLRMANNYVLSMANIPGVGRAVDPRATAGSTFSQTHAITKPFPRQIVVFRQPQSILREGPAIAGLTVEDIVKTNENSVAFLDLQFQKENGMGPFSIAVAVHGKYPGAAEGKEFNMVLVGDRDFASDMLFYQNLNRDLVANSMSALAKAEDLISISPKEVQRTQMTLTDTQFKMFVFVFLIPLPFAFYFLCGTLWYRRRYS